ncbi:hypothetical protein C8J57DRAFT_1524644 [Mycena rebaudengoi]|nr:hypothetical protein C8J57DRAFT_1524644 [Mycena rebaudengoi]
MLPLASSRLPHQIPTRVGSSTHRYHFRPPLSLVPRSIPPFVDVAFTSSSPYSPPVIPLHVEHPLLVLGPSAPIPPYAGATPRFFCGTREFARHRGRYRKCLHFAVWYHMRSRAAAAAASPERTGYASCILLASGAQVSTYPRYGPRVNYPSAVRTALRAVLSPSALSLGAAPLALRRGHTNQQLLPWARPLRARYYAAVAHVMLPPHSTRSLLRCHAPVGRMRARSLPVVHRYGTCGCRT